MSGSAVRRRECQREIPRAGQLRQRLQCRLDLLVQMQYHFLHQRRIRAHFVSQRRHRTYRHTDKIERRALAQLLFFEQALQKFKLGLQRERRRAIQRHEFPRTHGIVDQNAQRRRIGGSLQRLPFRVLVSIRGMGLPERLHPRWLLAGRPLESQDGMTRSGRGSAADQQFGVSAMHARCKNAAAGGGHLIGQCVRLGKACVGGDDFPRSGVVPGFGDDSMRFRIGSGGYGGEPGGGKRTGSHAAIRQKCALFHEPPESAGTELAGKLAQIVRAKLLGYEQDAELRPRRNSSQTRRPE